MDRFKEGGNDGWMMDGIKEVGNQGRKDGWMK